MSDETSNDRVRRGIQRPMILLGIVMTLAYLCLGGFILLFPQYFQQIPNEFRLVFGGMLIVYGLYRGWRIWADFGQ
jgi:hypothetical protein